MVGTRAHDGLRLRELSRVGWMDGTGHDSYPNKLSRLLEHLRC